MALISCPDCGKEISDTARVCINCGCKIKRDHKKAHKVIKITVLSFLFLIIIAIIILNMVLPKSTTAVFKAMDIIYDNNTWYRTTDEIMGIAIDYESYIADEYIEKYEDVAIGTEISGTIFIGFSDFMREEPFEDYCRILYNNHNNILNVQYYSNSKFAPKEYYSFGVAMIVSNSKLFGMGDEWVRLDSNCILSIYHSPLRYFIFK